MAGKISIECPACTAKLNLSDSSKLGKKIKCPKCSEIFIAEASDDDELFEDDEEADEEPVSSSNRRRSAVGGKDSAKGSNKGGKKTGPTNEGSNLPLIIGGVIALLVLVGGGLYFSGLFNKPLPGPPGMAAAPLSSPPMASSAPVQTPLSTPPSTTPSAPPSSPAETVLGLRWMPAETDMLFHAKLAEIWQAPLLKEPLSSPTVAPSLKEFEKLFGMPPSDIESISMGFVDTMGTVMKAMASGPKPGPPGIGVSAIPGMSPEDMHYVVVIKTKKPFDLKAFSQVIPNATLQEKNGKTYFEVPANLPVTPASGGWSPDATTLIMATTKELAGTIERGETNVPRKELKSLDSSPHLIIANVVPGTKQSEGQNGAPTPLTGPMGDLMKANEQYAIQLASIGLSVRGGFDLQVSTLSGTEEGAKKLKTEFEKKFAEFRLLFDGYKKTAPPLIADLGDLLFANLKIDEQNQTVKISASVPDSAKEKLEQLPPVVMMMAMTGGFGGGLGGLNGGPNFGTPGAFDMSADLSNASSSLRLPGQSESVEAASVEGLPEGMTLTASTAWSTPVVAPATNGLANGTQGAATTAASTVDILIDVTGDGIDAICAATGLASKSIKLDGGATLKKTKQVLPGGIDAQKTFIPFDVEHVLPLEHPPQTLRVRLTVDLPSNAGSTISLLEGSFKYLTAETPQELTVENVPQTAKQPLKGAEFKAGGVKLIRGPKDANPETLKLECAKDHYLGRVRGTPGDVTSVTEIEKGLTIQRIYAKQPEGKFPEEFEIQFKLYTDVKENTVTFRIENLPLPSPDSKPATPQQQQSAPQ